jgi:hypothetical protein
MTALSSSARMETARCGASLIVAALRAFMGAQKGAARWLADRAVDMIRDRFGWEAVGYASVVLGTFALHS